MRRLALRLSAAATDSAASIAPAARMVAAEAGSGNTAMGRVVAKTGTGIAAGTETGTETGGTDTLLRKVGGVTTIGTAAAGRAGAAEIAALWAAAAAGTRITGTRTGEENGNETDEGLAAAEPSWSEVLNVYWVKQKTALNCQARGKRLTV